jgi:uncharacterized protein YjaG (DUF416 family)
MTELHEMNFTERLESIRNLIPAIKCYSTYDVDPDTLENFTTLLRHHLAYISLQPIRWGCVDIMHYFMESDGHRLITSDDFSGGMLCIKGLTDPVYFTQWDVPCSIVMMRLMRKCSNAEIRQLAVKDGI